MVLSDRHRCALCYSTPPATCYLPMAWCLQHCVCLKCLLQGRLFSKRLLPWPFKCMGSAWHHVALSKKHIAVSCLGAGFSTLAGHVSGQKSSAESEQWAFAHFHAGISIYQFGREHTTRSQQVGARQRRKRRNIRSSGHSGCWERQTDRQRCRRL